MGVYPRVCGGTGVAGDFLVALRGLSPRVRGNPPRPRFGVRGSGVYPRVCGGTFVRFGSGFGC